MFNSTLFQQALKKSGLKQKHLADLCGMSENTFSVKKSGQRKFTKAERYVISHTLGLSTVDELCIFGEDKE